MNLEELRTHCENQVEHCEQWAEWKREEPHGKVYEEHKLILKLLNERKTGKWLINKERDTICCPFCNDKTKIGKTEVELLYTEFAGFRYCKYCGARNRV